MKTQNHLILGLGLSLVLATPGLTRAGLIAGFEGATLTEPTVGDAALVTASFGSLPPQGTQQLLLTTLSSIPESGNFSGTDAVSVAAAETFLGLAGGSIPDGSTIGDVSAVKLTLSLGVGDVVSFDYKFLTTATGGDGQDFAFYTLQLGSGTPSLVAFADVGDTTFGSSTAIFDYETATQTLTLAPVATAGIYTLGIGVADQLDDVIHSGILIDNVSVTPVPEPATVGMGLALMGVAFCRRRRGK